MDSIRCHLCQATGLWKPRLSGCRPVSGVAHEFGRSLDGRGVRVVVRFRPRRWTCPDAGLFGTRQRTRQGTSRHFFTIRIRPAGSASSPYAFRELTPNIVRLGSTTSLAVGHAHQHGGQNAPTQTLRISESPPRVEVVVAAEWLPRRGEVQRHAVARSQMLDGQCAESLDRAGCGAIVDRVWGESRRPLMATTAFPDSRVRVRSFHKVMLSSVRPGQVITVHPDAPGTVMPSRSAPTGRTPRQSIPVTCRTPLRRKRVRNLLERRVRRAGRSNGQVRNSFR